MIKFIEMLDIIKSICNKNIDKVVLNSKALIFRQSAEFPYSTYGYGEAISINSEDNSLSNKIITVEFPKKNNLYIKAIIKYLGSRYEFDISVRESLLIEEFIEKLKNSLDNRHLIDLKNLANA